MRRRLPTRKRAAFVRPHPRHLDAHKDLPAAVGIDDRPMRRDLGVALLDLEDEILRQRGSARRAGDLHPPPAEPAAKESPRVFEGARINGLAASLVRLRRNELPHGISVSACLDFRGQPVACKHDRRDDQADRLNVAEPFVVGIDPGHFSCPRARDRRDRSSPDGRRRHCSPPAPAPAPPRRPWRVSRAWPSSGVGRVAVARPPSRRTG